MIKGKLKRSLILTLLVLILISFAENCYAVGTIIDMDDATLSSPGTFDDVFESFGKDKETSSGSSSSSGLVGEEAYKQVGESFGKLEKAEMTVESARRQIANWGMAFKTSQGSKWIYSTNFAKRGATYKSGYPLSSYTFDCVGCVSYIVHYSIGINYFPAETGQSGFVTPQKNVRDTAHFELHTISAGDQPDVGDILIASKGQGGSAHNHVAIYCGDGKIVDCKGTETTINTVDSNWVEPENNKGGICKFTKFARLISIEGASFTPVSGGAVLPSGDGEIDLDLVAETFKYKGMPNNISYGKEETDVFRWIFDGVKGIVEFIGGLLLSFIRMPIVGLTSSVESMINKGISDLN